MSRITLDQCLWVQGENVAGQQCFHPTVRALDRRGAKVWRLGACAPAELERLREQLWKTDDHVILQGLLARELKLLYPIFKERTNFSVVLIDWWNHPFWFTRNATYLISHNYSMVAVRTGRGPFLAGSRPPWFLFPEKTIRYELLSALCRPPALAAAPILEAVKWWQRSGEKVDASRLLYFPLPVEAGSVPLKTEPPRFDFSNLGATMGTWLMRDPYASAWLNFANLYSDRQRLISLLAKLNGNPFAIYDRRKDYRFLPWEELCGLIRRTRYLVCTGGLQHSAIPKYLEYVCMGTPILGATLPYEFPWLDGCVFLIDAMRVTLAELKSKLSEALEVQPRLRENCLAAREKVLALYEPGRLLDLLQEQLDGRPMPPGYLKPASAPDSPRPAAPVAAR